MRPDIKESLDAYWNTGRPTGDFLKAVLSNDLFDAVGRADHENIRDLKEIVSYIYNELPQNAHGSKDNVRYYIESFRRAREKDSDGG